MDRVILRRRRSGVLASLTAIAGVISLGLAAAPGLGLEPAQGAVLAETKTTTKATAAATGASAPGSPTSVTAVALNGGATVSWSPAPSNGSAITGYVIVPSAAGSPLAPISFGGTASTTSYSVWNLVLGTTYTFTVAEVTAAGTSAPSAPSAGVVPFGKPGVPQNVVATAANASATVTWTAPSANGSAITSYIVTPYVNGVAQTAQTFASGATTEVVTGLVNGSGYEFSVTAVNAAGQSSPSSASNQVWPMAATGAPTSVAATPLNGGATVTWSPVAPNGGQVKGYVIVPSAAGAPLAAISIGGSLTTKSYTVWSLTNGTIYTFTVAEVTSAGTSPPSAPSAGVVPFGKPGVPTQVVATAGAASATVTWQAPFNNGSAITSYLITPWLMGTAQAVQTFSSPATTEVVTGLVNGKGYEFSVTAVNAAGQSSPSSSSNQVWPSAVPAAPTAVAATPLDGADTVWWTAPPQPSSPVTGYVVTPYVGSTALAPVVFNTPVTAQDVGALTDGTAYAFTVAAVNVIGTGPASALSNTATPAPQPTTFDDEFAGPSGAGINYGMSQNYWLLNGCWTSGCGNNSPTAYSANNAFLDGQGDLVLEATQGASGSCGSVACAYTGAGYTMVSWTSASGATWGQQYGTFSARIQMPVGQGLWPAFTMNGTDEVTVGWPQEGELDIVEGNGAIPNGASGHAIASAGPSAPTIRFGQGYTLPNGGLMSGWHVYSATWSPYGIMWQVDGVTVQAMPASVMGAAWTPAFEQPFTMNLDLTVGGGNLALPNSSTVFPAKMLVDWVRVTS